MNRVYQSENKITKGRYGHSVLGTFIDAYDWDSVVKKLMVWAKAHESRYVCLCNVHMVITAFQDQDLNQVLNNADIIVPDGMPIAWALRRFGYQDQARIDGPSLMKRVCCCSATQNTSFFFYGSTKYTLNKLQQRLKAFNPGMKIVGAYSPPFRDLTPAEDKKITDTINASGAGIVFVGLGCPKQEMWMATHRGQINAVMLGVGAAFDFHAGTVRRAPQWMRRNGLEWLYRFFQEPRRLWKRYAETNSLFVWLMMKDLLLKDRNNVGK